MLNAAVSENRAISESEKLRGDSETQKRDKAENRNRDGINTPIYTGVK